MASYEGSIEGFWQTVMPMLTKPGVPISDIHAEQIHGLLNTAYRWLLESLAAAHVSDALFQTDTGVAANTTTLSFASIGPSELLTPQALWERRDPSTEQWQPMEFRHPLPVNAVLGPRLRWWDIGNVGEFSSGLKFVGATVATSIKLHYIGRVAQHISDPREAVALLGCTNILAAYVAHLFCLAERTREGRAQAAEFLGMAREHLHNYIQRDVKLWQMRPVRSRRPRFGLTHRKGY